MDEVNEMLPLLPGEARVVVKGFPAESAIPLPGGITRLLMAE
jgi:hypothetical protein